MLTSTEAGIRQVITYLHIYLQIKFSAMKKKYKEL